jgi:hypothetical protein
LNDVGQEALDLVLLRAPRGLRGLCGRRRAGDSLLEVLERLADALGQPLARGARPLADLVRTRLEVVADRLCVLAAARGRPAERENGQERDGDAPEGGHAGALPAPAQSGASGRSPDRST